MDDQLNAFTAALASTAPTPGGGGAAGAAGALAASLGAMAASLAARRKNARGGERLALGAAHCEELRQRFLGQIEADAEAFLPLAAAYRLPKDAPGRGETLRRASLSACGAAETVLLLASETAGLLHELAPLIPPLLLSDLGCAAACCAAALRSAAYNILVNIQPYPGDVEALRLRRLVLERLELDGARLRALEQRVLEELGGAA